LGDWNTNTAGLGYTGAAHLIIAMAPYVSEFLDTVLFWTAFILTEPLDATVNDFLDKPHA
jgi:uncharacterized membrane-anchored protein